VESRKLAFDLPKARRAGHEKEQATFGAVADRRATDCIQVEASADEETGDVRHGSRMVADAQVENDGRHNDKWFFVQCCDERVCERYAVAR
jgi:hypothetical protein